MKQNKKKECTTLAFKNYEAKSKKKEQDTTFSLVFFLKFKHAYFA